MLSLLSFVKRFEKFKNTKKDFSNYIEKSDKLPKKSGRQLSIAVCLYQGIIAVCHRCIYIPKNLLLPVQLISSEGQSGCFVPFTGSTVPCER